MSRNPVAGNAWKYNRTSVIQNKKTKKDRKKVRELLKMKVFI